MTTVLQAAASDATVSELQPTKNFQGSTTLQVGAPSSVDRFAFVYFNRPFPIGAKIVSATLRLTQQAASSGGTRTLRVMRVAAPGWKESTLTYNNRPTIVAGESNLSASNGVAGTVREWDVASLLQAVSDGAAWYGFRIDSTHTAVMVFHSREAVEFQPELEVEWSDAPDAPQQLSPSNGRAVSVARPLHTWDFTDVTGDDALSAFQIQTAATNDFTSPVIDTGWTAASEPAWVPTADLAVAATRWWRVRNKDLAGNEGDWSDPTSYTRTAKIAATLTNPAASPNDIVYEPLPTFSWTVSGGTQTAFQVFITDPDDPTEVLWDSSKRSNDDGAVALPSTAQALSPGESYNIVLRVWDAVAREATAGDTAYTEVSRTFTYGLSGSSGAVTSLAVSTTDGTPDAQLTWSRSTTPDSFSVLRDGVTIASDLDPADLSTGGTGYAWADLSASPRIEHEWTVLAVEGGLASDANPTITGTTAPKGVWLATTDGVHRVCLSSLNDQPVSFGPSELSEVFKPPGATNPVLITQAVFGREGGVSGTLDTVDGTLAESLAEWVAITNRKRYPRGTPMVLTLTDTAMRVFIYNVARHEKDEFSDFIPVEFSYCELL